MTPRHVKQQLTLGEKIIWFSTIKNAKSLDNSQKGYAAVILLFVPLIALSSRSSTVSMGMIVLIFVMGTLMLSTLKLKRFVATNKRIFIFDTKEKLILDQMYFNEIDRIERIVDEDGSSQLLFHSSIDDRVFEWKRFVSKRRANAVAEMIYNNFEQERRAVA